jgi:hypothetical protein
MIFSLPVGRARVRVDAGTGPKSTPYSPLNLDTNQLPTEIIKSLTRH